MDYEVDVEGGLRLRVTGSADARFTPGEPVLLTAPAEACVPLTESTG
jgi:hypothetical protein